MSDLHDLPATEAIARFTARELSPVEYVGAVVERAERTHAALNALPIRFSDAALDAAREAEARYAGKGGGPRPLEGIPVAVKEDTPIAGQPWTRGSLIHRDAVAEVTAPIAERILAAGGIVHARSAASEFSCAAVTTSRLWGPSRNPWNPDYAPGGSSGGSAAAVAIGAAALGTGSDIGGSIRWPAACCGILGFKPPFGRVPSLPPYGLDEYFAAGPLARTVADAALLQNVLAGPDPRDHASVAPKLEIPARLEDVEGWRIALSLDLGFFDVAEDMVAATLAAADALRDAGALVEEVELSLSREDVFGAAAVHMASLFGQAVARLVARHRAQMTPYAIAFAERSLAKELGGGATLRAREAEGRVQAGIAAALERHRVLLCPTFAVSAYGLEDADQLPEDGMTLPFNIAGRCPVMAAPSGFGAVGVPTSVQIVGRPFDDASVFAAAAALEAAGPVLGRPPI